ncbi:ABC transporter substrate-binding protein [Gryllotalpicola protaetiae]|uniref:Amino acid ABC transporter substrate-binding protein n=1 Tax=Gryllotalpicola protaetiae TaxID=2419771 RepID=A0A387BWY8_9MICO|nr:ABC transporter substrate-binding protein [Gryllotalpicola protaetiae]AYG02851.1 amino acid ABC transporter substrate-binding protein [Gryllotalpicola protaetiae]
MPARTRIAALALTAAAALALTACSAGSNSSSGADGYVTKGKLTIATSQPAYAPWVDDNKPASGKGFEAAVAYAVADKLGFSKSDVTWVRDDFDKSIAPGPKDFDLNLQQFSITAERKKAVDFSTPYYTTSQVVITTAKSKAAGATSLADLKGDLIGAMTGTTSYTDAVADIAPSQQVQVFNSNDDAVAALKAGQVDAIVVDLPTGFYITGAELDNGKIVGQLPAVKGDTGDQFGIVLPKGSKLTTKVSDAVDALQKDGTLAQLEQKWLNSQGNAPLLT